MAGLDEDMESFYGTEEVRNKIEDKWNKHIKADT